MSLGTMRGPSVPIRPFSKIALIGTVTNGLLKWIDAYAVYGVSEQLGRCHP